ncbi:MAG: leucine-rich repeat protein [Clostridia bacterium]|nr:leucine-rich repeat protein [Clostridia bacterium]
MKKENKVVALLLVFLMLIQVLPFSSFGASIVSSGTCGENLTWTLDSDGTLTITGNGTMNDYEWYSIPWDFTKVKNAVIEYGVTNISNIFDESSRHDEYEGQLQSVSIPSSVTAIAESAFHSCIYLKELAIPDSVTEIGAAAFFGCTALEKISLPAGLTVINDRLFCDCNKLAEIEIPSSVTSIGEFAFSDCSTLTSISIPDSVVKIGTYAFNSCSSLTTIELPKNIERIGYAWFGGCNSLTEFTIPNSVTTIEPRAFWMCDNLSNVVISENVTDIGYSAFSDCPSLTKIVIPENVTALGYDAFSNCPLLAEIVIPKSISIIDYNTFDGCNSLTDVYYTGSEYEWNNITIQSGNDVLGSASIHFNYTGEQSYSGTYNGAEWTLENGVLTVTTDKGLFFDNEGPWFKYADIINEIILNGDKICVIDWCICEYPALQEIRVSENSEYHSTVDGVLFNKEMTSLLAYPAGKTATIYTVPDGIETIGFRAFKNAETLTEIILPAGITEIGHFAFDNTGYSNDWSNWVNDYSEEGNGGLLYIDEYLVGYLPIWGDNEMGEYLVNPIVNVRPGTVLMTGVYTDVEEIILPASVQYLDSYSLQCFGLKRFTVDADNPQYTVKDGVLFNKNMTTLIAYPAAKSGAEYEIPATVSGIVYDAFNGVYNWNKELTDIYFHGTEEQWNENEVDLPDRITVHYLSSPSVNSYDLDGDGVLTEDDAVEMLGRIVYGANVWEEDFLNIADRNQDGRISSFDARDLLREIRKINDSDPDATQTSTPRLSLSTQTNADGTVTITASLSGARGLKSGIFSLIDKTGILEYKDYLNEDYPEKMKFCVTSEYDTETQLSIRNDIGVMFDTYCNVDSLPLGTFTFKPNKSGAASVLLSVRDGDIYGINAPMAVTVQFDVSVTTDQTTEPITTTEPETTAPVTTTEPGITESVTTTEPETTEPPATTEPVAVSEPETTTPGGSDSQTQQRCKYCGKVHNGVFGKIVQFFHNILYFFKNIFGKK